MARKCVADLEANGLLDEADIIWCAVFKDINTQEVFKFHHGQPNWERKCKAFMDGCETLIMHNGLGYDWPLLRKLWGYDYKGRKVDTLLISRLHNPDRQRPRGMTGKSGPHSIEAWGYRLGRGKPEHEDWTQFSEDMLYRCSEDVEIQYLTMLALHKEGKDNNWQDAYNLTFKLFEILQLQEEYGWLADKPYMERCVRQLTTWIDRIDRAVGPHLPMRLVIEETKVKGEYGYIKKPFLKSGRYSASVQRWVDSAYPDIGDDGSNPVSRIVVGQFSRVSFRKTNLDSGDEMKQFLLAEGWQPKNWNYKKDENGRPTDVRTSPKLDQHDPFIGVNGKVGKLCAKRIQVRHRRSNIEGWISSIRTDGRIAGRVTGIAATGRMKHAGIVNVPNSEAFYGKQMRKCFTCAEGFKLVSVDADACQNKMLGQRANSKELSRILIEEDTHSLVRDAVNSVLSKHNMQLITRGKAKGIGFAYRFGASDNKLGALVEGSKNIGAEIRDAINAVFPAQAALLDRLTEEWESNAKTRVNAWGKTERYDGFIAGLDGRPIKIQSPHQILVYMLQSDEAIMMAAGYCFAYKLISEKLEFGKDWGFVLWMHDEYTVECKEEHVLFVKECLEKSITMASEHFEMWVCPQTGTADIGHTWLEVH